MSTSIRSLASCLVISAAACSSSEPTGSAAVAHSLGAAPSSQLVGTWDVKDPSYPGGVKVELELASDGNFTLHDNSVHPATSTSGTWGVVGSELDLISDSTNATTYRRTAWTYLVDPTHLGIAVVAAGATSGPVGTWQGALIDQQVGPDGTAMSGDDVAATIVLASDGSATSHTVTTNVGAAPTIDDETGTYTVSSDGSLSLSLHEGNASRVEQLAPCAGGYANAIMVHP